MDKSRLDTSGTWPESVAVTVKPYVPAVVGTPCSAPVDASNETPAGRVPAVTDHA